jgi:uncharacterized protein
MARSLRLSADGVTFAQARLTWGVSKWLAVGSVPGSIAGVLTVDALHNRYGYGFDSTLLALVAIALLVVALSVLARALFGVPREQHSVPMGGA